MHHVPLAHRSILSRTFLVHAKSPALLKDGPFHPATRGLDNFTHALIIDIQNQSRFSSSSVIEGYTIVNPPFSQAISQSQGDLWSGMPIYRDCIQD